jgi:hypothetical protein
MQMIDLSKYRNPDCDEYMSEETSVMLKEFIGHRISMCMINADHTTMYWCVDGEWYVIGAEGDCCSESWFNHCDNAGALIDATLLEFEDVEVGEIEEDREQQARHKRAKELLGDGDDDNGNDYIVGNMLKFKTNKGHCTIEFRNASNGYYKGYASVSEFKSRNWKEKNKLDIAKELEDF